MRRAFLRDRRNLGRPEGARLHRDAAAGGGVGTNRHTVLAGAAGRQREPERRADALADRIAPSLLNELDPRAPGLAAWDADLFRARGFPPGRWKAMHMKRIASIWLPALAIERWAKASDFAPDAPVVLTVEGTHGPLIHAVTKEASERGARTGARLTDARALDPSLIAVPADPEGDQALLRRFAKWAGRWSPLIEVDGGDALRLDVSGVAHLFGGEDGLADDIRTRFAHAGLTARVAIAPTTAAAWALARYQPSSSPLDIWPRLPVSSSASIPTRCGRSNGLA